jgi:hypothetical protein
LTDFVVSLTNFAASLTDFAASLTNFAELTDFAELTNFAECLTKPWGWAPAAGAFNPDVAPSHVRQIRIRAAPRIARTGFRSASRGPALMGPGT